MKNEEKIECTFYRLSNCKGKIKNGEKVCCFMVKEEVKPDDRRRSWRHVSK